MPECLRQVLRDLRDIEGHAYGRLPTDERARAMVAERHEIAAHTLMAIVRDTPSMDILQPQVDAIMAALPSRAGATASAAGASSRP